MEANKFLEQCSHSEWGAWDVFPANEWTMGDHVTEFSDCFYQNADLGVGQLWPRAGAPVGIDNAISFKWITGYPKHSAYANFTSIRWNEGLMIEWNALYDDILNCDAGRVYQSQVMNTP